MFSGSECACILPKVTPCKYKITLSKFFFIFLHYRQARASGEEINVSAEVIIDSMGWNADVALQGLWGLSCPSQINCA